MSTLVLNGTNFTYSGFSQLMNDLVTSNRTSGINQSASRIHFTSLNKARMERIHKTTILADQTRSTIQRLEHHQTWYVITEAWCGDSAQSLPIIAKIAEANPKKVDLKIILRDENPEWIDKYHTSGSRSIPKLIAFDDWGNELLTWGPRPVEAQKLFLTWKENPEEKSWGEFEKELHTWYARDKGNSIQHEITKCLSSVKPYSIL